jgi:hypothetical protein
MMVKIYRDLKKFANETEPRLKKDWYKYYVVVNYEEIEDRFTILPDVTIKNKTFLKNVEKSYQLHHPHPVNPIPKAHFY